MSEIVIGSMVGEYEVLEQLGTGGFGKVYKVKKEDPSGVQFYALKHISLPSDEQYNEVLVSMNNDQELADNYFKGMLNDVVMELTKMRDLAKKNSRYFVTYYDHEIAGTPKKYDIFVRMELLSSLTNFAKENEIRIKDVIRMGKDILSGLSICHNKKIIHRDVKEANIFVDADGDYKLGDFGVSKSMDTTVQMMSRKGTPFYMSPEMTVGKKYGMNVDLYALAIVMYKMLNYSRFPFMPPYPKNYDMKDIEESQNRKIMGEIPGLPQCAPNDLGEVIVKGLLSDSERYQTAEEFLEAISQVEKTLSADELSTVVIKPNLQNVNKEQKTVANTFSSVSTEAKVKPQLYKRQEEKELKEELLTYIPKTPKGTKLGIIFYIVPCITMFAIALGINVIVQDIPLSDVQFFNDLPFRIVVLAVLAAITIFFIVYIIVFPDKKTMELAFASKQWKKECKVVIDEIYDTLEQKTANDETNKSYKTIRSSIYTIEKNIQDCKRFWKMTIPSHENELQSYHQICKLQDMIVNEEDFVTVLSMTETKTIGSENKSGILKLMRSINQNINLRNANLKK